MTVEMIIDNERGSFMMHCASEEVAVKDIRFDNIPDDCLMDIETAEHVSAIAKVSEIPLQLSLNWESKRFFAIFHTGPSTAFVVRFDNIEWKVNESAASVIERDLATFQLPI